MVRVRRLVAAADEVEARRTLRRGGPADAARFRASQHRRQRCAQLVRKIREELSPNSFEPFKLSNVKENSNRKLAAKYHPDHNPATAEVMKDLNELWQALKGA